MNNELRGVDSIKHFITKNKLDKIGFNPITYATNIIEELLELLTELESSDAKKIAETIIDNWVKEYNIDTNKIDDYKAVDSIGDIIVFSIGGLLKKQYDPNCVLTEIGKEINSRKQDPKQAKDWKENGVPLGAKWLKDLNQPEKEKYKADFKNCSKKN